MKTRFLRSSFSLSDDIDTGNFVSQTTPSKKKRGNGNYTSDIVNLESGGNYKATNPNSSAAGKYQFLWSLWGNKIMSKTGVKSKQEFLNTPEAQDDFYNNYYVPNEMEPAVNRIKQQTGTTINDDSLRKLYHYRGEQGAIDYLSGQLEDQPEEYNMPISKYTGIKKMNLGGVISTYSSIAKPIGDLIEGDGTNPMLSSLSGALQFGAIGAITKGIQANKALQAQNELKAKNNHNFLQGIEGYSRGAYSQLGLNQNRGFYRKGGVVSPQYEAEKGETVIGDANLEDGKELAQGIHKVGGKSHEQGGTLGEGGEFVFSNDIKLNNDAVNILKMLNIKSKPRKTSYAEATTKLGKLKSKFERNSFDYKKSNTDKVMSGRILQSIQQLAALQEKSKKK